MSFVLHVLKSRGQPVERVYLLDVYTPDKKKCYYFVLVDPHKEPAFLKAISAGKGYDLKDFGKVLASGYGAPPAKLKKEMSERYQITYTN
jgi:hypothetical protein